MPNNDLYKQLEVALNMPAEDEGHPDSENLVDIKTGAPMQKIGAFRVPYGFEVWDDGVYRRLWAKAGDDYDWDAETPSIERLPSSDRFRFIECIIDKPLWLRGVAHEADTNEILLDVVWTNGTQVTKTVKQADFGTRAGLERLVNSGFPFVSASFSAVQRYIRQAVRANTHNLTARVVAGRLGYHRGADPATGNTFHGYLLSNSWIGTEEVQVQRRDQDLYLSNHYRTEGHEAVWFHMAKEVLSISVTARWLIMSTFAAPLIDILGGRTFVVHHWGQTASGKTATAKFGASAWGNPHELKHTFNTTQKGMVELMLLQSGLPVLFDELQSATTTKNITNTIYMLTNERGRQRLDSQGNLIGHQGTWKTVIRTTGEQALVTSDSGLGGQLNRVLQVSQPSITGEQARKLHKWMDQPDAPYGWGGKRFLEKLHSKVLGRVEATNRLTTLHRSLHEAACTHAQKFDFNLDARALALADVAVATYLYELWGLGHLDHPKKDDCLKLAQDDLCAMVEHFALCDEELQLPGTQALALLNDSLNTYAAKWLYADDPDDVETWTMGYKQEVWGVIKGDRDELWVSEARLRSIVGRQLPVARVLKDWKDNGIIKAPRGKGRDWKHPRRITRGGKSWSSKVFVVHLHKLDRNFEGVDKLTE